MKTYRSKFLPENTVAIVPEHGYQKRNYCSTIALKYFTWLQHTTGKTIQHGNSKQGEFKVGKYSVDAYIPEENRIIEFYGCAFHGHYPDCFKADTLLPTKRTAEKEYERTMIRENEIRDMGYKIEHVWECEVRKELKVNDKMREYFENIILGGSINPRDAFFGGRCNPHKLLSKKENGKVIKYLDFTSLYPSCNFETEYPVGVPEVIQIEYDQQNVLWNKPSDYNIKGLIKVFIIPPRGLIIPVVPYKVGDFLLFPLCRSCCYIHEKDESSRGIKTCNHTDDERGFVSTLTHMELNLALTKGYVVTKYYGAYNYKEWSTDLFKPYVKKFLRLKVEADGWPPNVHTEEEKDKFIREYKEKFDIDIDKNNVKKNSAFRYIYTDSVIFECREGFCPLSVGNYLGELTDEVGPDEEIIEEYLPSELHDHIITVRDYIRYFSEKPSEKLRY
uniref:DNA-directed DNA polymerase n=1 Tax=Panagrolaimus sp. PS1159 TaxID=55785 RepID=A0AC35GBJ0_9BILA